MEVSAYNIIKKIVVTQKSGELYQKTGNVTLEVEKSANKVVIRKAVEQIWDVKVDSVNVIRKKGQVKRRGRQIVKRSGKKKAIISLKQGHVIDLQKQFEGAVHTGEGSL